MSGNIRNNYTYNKCDLRLSNHKFYDLFLSTDHITLQPVTDILSDNTLIAYFDFDNNDIYSTGTTSANTIYSLYEWSDAVNSGETLYDIGLTAIDNGLIKYEVLSGDTGNTQLFSVMTESELYLNTGDTRFILNSITGNTSDYIYPIEILDSSVGKYAQLCGGFYQGFYKLDGYDYQTLPNRYGNGWVAELWLNKTDICSGYTGTTLNDIYPDNKGFFFYIGTRAENKFWNTFSGNTSGGTTGDTVYRETNMLTSTGVPISPSSYNVTEVCNQFLIYNRGENGFTTCEIEQGSCLSLTSTTVPNQNLDNLFLVMNRGETGKTACDDVGRMVDLRGTNKNVLSDIYDNAIGFRIKDDGSIGYRKITYTGNCNGDTTIIEPMVIEGYSLSGMVNDDEWTHISIRFLYDSELDGCDLINNPPRTGKLMFYVNSKLKYVVRDIDEIIPYRLDDDKTKQQGVPFNISIGGGSQGLIDSQTFDGKDNDDKNLLIETNFAGTFIGGISKFRLYNDKLCYCTIQDNYNIEKNMYI